MLREVNHRVGNSLQIIASLLHLQASSTNDDDIKAALTNAMGRVAAVAQVHRRLYTSHDLKSVMLNQYLEALLEDLRRSAEGNRMSRLTLDAEPVEIDLVTRSSTGRFIRPKFSLLASIQAEIPRTPTLTGEPTRTEWLQLLRAATTRTGSTTSLTASGGRTKVYDGC